MRYINIKKKQREAKYKKILSENNISINNYNLDLYSLLYNEVYKVADKSIYYTLNLLIDYLFYKYVNLSITHNNSSLLLISYYHGNSKRDRQWENIKSIFKNENYDEMIVEFKNRRKSTFKLFKNKYKLLIGSLNEFKGINSIKDKLFFSIKLSYLKELKIQLETMSYNYKVGMCFYDSGFFENLIVPYLRYSSNLIMVTFQYGQPIFYSDNHNLRNQSQIINFKSNLYLAKNAFTKKQFVKYGINEKHIVIVGSNCKPSIYQEKKNDHTFGLFLDCATHDFSEESNNKMIVLANEICRLLNYKCIIKPHPLDHKKYKYSKKYCTFIYEPTYNIDDISRDIDFAIIHSSSIVLDLIEKRIKIFEYSLGLSPLILNDPLDVFTNSANFFEIFTKWNNLKYSKKNEYFSSKIKEYLIPVDFKEETRKTIHELL